MNPIHPEFTIDTLYEALHQAGWNIGDIVGRDADGKWSGLHTVSVETWKLCPQVRPASASGLFESFLPTFEVLWWLKEIPNL
jgi:hypothetical protein